MLGKTVYRTVIKREICPDADLITRSQVHGIIFLFLFENNLVCSQSEYEDD